MNTPESSVKFDKDCVIIQWRKNGTLHRLDGPAVEWINGTKSWYQNGELHRLDGPAIEAANGDKYWYIYGIVLTENEYAIRIKNE